MSIVSTKLAFVQAASASDYDARHNGGRMTPLLIQAGKKNNLFPDVSFAERMSGLTTWRKFFFHLQNDENSTLTAVKISLTKATPGVGYCLLYQGTQENMEAELAGNERAYGAAQAASSARAGASSLSLIAKDEFHAKAFQSGDSIWISDGVNSERHDEVNIVNLFPVLLLELANGDALEHDFYAGAVVASAIQCGDVACSFSDWRIANASTGTYDIGNNPLELSNLGSVFDRWTLTFLSPTEFYVTGGYSGAQSIGNTGEDYAPNNPDFNRPFFTVKAAGWKGAWQQGDCVTFTTTPASVPFWVKRVIPAGAKIHELDDGTAFLISGVTT